MEVGFDGGTIVETFDMKDFENYHRCDEVGSEGDTSAEVGFVVDTSADVPFDPGRGLRQGDPLSPYLFILCGEVFSALINRAMLTSSLHGVKISRSAPVISHHLFADDSVVFARATAEETGCVREILSTYERVSGQVINLDKSTLTCSRNVTDVCLNHLKGLLNVKAVECFDKYLGLPTIVGKSKTQIFNFVKDRVWKKLKGWKERSLSRAGREVLVKAVAQAIPSYVMSCFLLPDSLCSQIKGMISQFYWGGDVTHRTCHWLKWKALCRPKICGGLGFRDFKAFNTALVAKNWWRIMTKPESMLAQIYKAVYFPNQTLFEATKGYRPSYAWSSLLNSAWIFHDGGLWRVGNDTSIRAWDDKWIPNCGPIVYREDAAAELGVLHVSDLMLPMGGGWDRNKVEFLCWPPTARAILSIPLSFQPHNDCFFWPDTGDGCYTSKSGYSFIKKKQLERESSSSSSLVLAPALWTKLWKADAAPRCRETAWRACLNLLPVRSTLHRRGVALEPCCPRCPDIAETVQHALLFCPFAKLAWFASPLNLRFDEESTVHDFFCRFLAVADTTSAGTFKLNFDASVKNRKEAGAGMIVRNRNGEFLAAATTELGPVLSAVLAEALGMRWALGLAAELGFRRLWLETDCLVLLNYWNRRDGGLSHLDTIVRDCRLLLSHFDVFNFTFVRRTGNCAADALAHLAFHYGCMVWIEEAPPEITSVVHNDVHASMTSS
ncbi:uncharacterized protein LOC130749012 [Lotus japonicus]|uniref:uncharacterized protein LOC130749012 n=1 Tax=Lotus japonicus TaxID=34305 RepID=UPI002585E907|nr:uncharacterized protein LOC130749012 [Lotus japonicus]